MPQVLAVADFSVEFQSYSKGSVITFTDQGVIDHLRSRRVISAHAGEVASAIAGGAIQMIHNIAKLQDTRNLLQGCSLGRQICAWPSLNASVGSSLVDIRDRYGVLKRGVRVVRSAGGSFAEAPVVLAPYTPAKGTYPSIGVEIVNPGTRALDFRIRIWANGAARSVVYGGSVKPTGGVAQLVTLSPRATVQSNWTFPTDQIGAVRVDQYDGGSNGAWLPGEELIFCDTYADLEAESNFFFSFDDVPSWATRRVPFTATTPASGRSILDRLAKWNLPAMFYIVPSLIGGPASNITLEEVFAIQKAGHGIGNHSRTHPIDANGAGLRLLGPYGYRRSLQVGNGFADCEIVSANAATGVFTCRNDHKLLTGSKLELVNATPSGTLFGTAYWVHSLGGKDFKLCTTAGNANAGIGIPVPANWAGVAEWKYPGSRPDHLAILEDLMGGIIDMHAMGIRGHEWAHALPQGGWDHSVRTAIELTPIRHVRGIQSIAANHRDIQLGWTTGGTYSSTDHLACGFPHQSAWTTDSGPNAAQAVAYVDECKDNGYTGCIYHHSGLDTPDVLEAVMARVAAHRAAGLMKTPTLKEFAERMGLMT